MGIYSAGAAEAPLWSVLLMFASLQVVWTLLVRTFPSLLGSAFLRHLDHRFSEKLERTKADLQGAHTALKASVDFLSVGQGELRSRVISATELLWKMIRDVQHEYRLVVMTDHILLPEEITEGIQGKRKLHTIEALRPFRSDDHHLAIIERLDNPEYGKARLYVGDRLWLIAYVTRAVHGRRAVLLQRSFQENQYKDWKDDEHMRSLVASVLPEEVYNYAIAQQLGGFGTIASMLEVEFLREARRVMSGSQGFADALSDMHSALSYERQKVSAVV